MIFYSWTALSGSERTPRGIGDRGPAGEAVAMGITDDRGRAMRAGEDSLGSGLAATVIIEVVRPAMAARTLAPCYVRTGVGWLGRCDEAGEVAWNRFFLRGDPDDPPAAGRMGA
jgi:hypothetical protein